MAINPGKRKQKLERRKAKRKAKQGSLLRQKNTGLAQRLGAAAAAPILDCGAAESLWSQGLGSVWFSRQLADGSIAAAAFLVDRGCLGVKDAFVAVLSRFAYESDFRRKMHQNGPVRNLAPAAARKYVEAAVEYARDLGLAPHPDYHKARLIFGNLDSAGCAEEIEFGQGGKPHFIAGPHDSPQRCREILNTLLHRCGPDGFYYTLPIGMPHETLPEPLRKSLDQPFH